MRYLYIILLFTCLKGFSQDISFISLSPNVYMNPAYAGFQSCYDCDYHFELHHRQQWTVTSPKALHASLFTADRNFNLTGSGISRPTNMSLGFFWLNSLEGESNYETNNFALMSAFSSSLGSNSLQFSMAFQIGHTRIDFDDNLIYSNPEKIDLKSELENIGLIDWFERYENGLEQDVGERGANVSAGERQFIALLRAVLAKRQIIVFDEATANLDIESESSILDATDTLLDYQTSVVIAHRLETILNAEKILVMSDGKLVGFDNHETLLSNNEIYQQLFSAWNLVN